MSFLTQTYHMGPLSALRLETSMETDIYRDLIYAADRNNLKEYEYLVNTIVPSILKKTFRNVTIERVVEEVEVRFPTFYVNNKSTKKQEAKLLTPLIAKQTQHDYMCKIVCVIASYDIATGNFLSRETKVVGSIPTMVGSCRCITSVKPDEINSLDEHKMSLGEDPSIYGGYFIKKGASKTILAKELLGTSIILTVETKGTNKRVETRITELHESMTFLMRLQAGKNRASVKVLPPFLRGKHYGIFLTIYLLSVKILNQKDLPFRWNIYVDKIASFAPFEEQDNIKAYLNTSVYIFTSKYTTIDEDGNYLINENLINAYIVKKSRNKNSSKDTMNTTTVIEKLFNEIFVSAKTSCEKIANLCNMASQHIRCCLKLRPLSSRDDWAKKRLKTAVSQIESDITENILPKLASGGVDDGGWRIGKHDKSENILESLKTDSTSLIRSLYSKVSAVVDEKSKTFSLRAVSQSGYGVIDPAKTSEGSKCGINKHKTICNRISNNSEHIPNRLDPIYNLARNSPTFSSHIKDNINNKLLYFNCGKLRTAKVELIPGEISDLFTELINSNYSIDELLDNEITDDIYISDDFLEYFSNHEIFIKLLNENKIEIEGDDENIIISFSIENSNTSEFAKRIQMWNGGSIYLECNDEIASLFKDVFAIANDYFSIINIGLYNYTFNINGNVLICGDYDYNKEKLVPIQLWTNHNKIIKHLKQLRLNKELPFDCCIAKQDLDKVVQYFDDAGRPLTPYMTINEDGQLLLDVYTITVEDKEVLLKDYIWGNSENLEYDDSEDRVQILFDYGLVEYVDSKELESTFMAKSIEECRAISKLKTFLDNIDIKESDSYVSTIYNQNKSDIKFMNSDMQFVTYGKNRYNIEFVTDYHKYVETEPIHIFSRVDHEIKELKLYAIVPLKFKHYYPTNKNVVILKKTNCQIRDGLHLSYIEDGEVKWVPKKSVSNNATTYFKHKIIGVRFNEDTVNKILSVDKKGDYYYEPCDFNYFVKSNNKNYVSIKDGKITYHKQQLKYDKDGTLIIYDMIDFGNKTEGFFEFKENTKYIPLKTDDNYDFYDEEKEKEEYDNNIKNDFYRESDLLVSEIRRKIEPIHDFQLTDDNKNEFIKMIMTEFPSFQRKSNLYKLKRYFHWRFKFTHVAIDPNIIYSSTANLCIKANHNQGPRFTYQCSMGTQALGLGNVMWSTTFETSIKRATASKQHIYETVAEEPLAGVTMPTRENYVIAVLPHRRGPEDAIIMSKSVFELTARYDKEVTIKLSIKNEEGVSQRITYPRTENGNKNPHPKYRHLDDNGYPVEGSIIETGECIIGIEKTDLKTGKRFDVSKFALIGEEGEITRVRIFASEETKKELLIYITLSQRRAQQIGNKFAAPHSQKGTIGFKTAEADTKGSNISKSKYLFTNKTSQEQLKFDDKDDIFSDYEGLYLYNDFNDSMQGTISSFFPDPEALKAFEQGLIKIKVVDDNKMPIVRGGPNDGLAIQVLFSPLSFPSRMTMGMNFEIFIGKACYLIQKKANGTTFHDTNYKFYANILKEWGLDINGCEFLSHYDGEIMIDSTTGNQFIAFIGICSYQVLKHQVYDKRSFRGTGNRDPIFKQPNHGRPLNGAQKFGEMERDTLLSHGGSELLLDRLLYASDAYDAIVCENCGNKSNKSDITVGVCAICKISGKLAITQQTMVYTVFTNYLAGMCLNIKSKYTDV